jgi:hypothetical protein
VASDTLTIVGTPLADRLALRLAPGDPTTLNVDFGDDGSADQSFSRSTFSHIDVFLLSGDDQLRVDQSNGLFADEALTVDAAAGDDTVQGGDGNDVVFGGSGNDLVDGNKGVDTALFGPGQDVFVWDPGDGSDTVDGGNGADTLVFNGSNQNETFGVTANGTGWVLRRDPGNVRMDMQDVELLDLAALGGADAVRIGDLSGTGLDRATVDLGVEGVGDGQGDAVTVNGTESADHISVDSHGTDVLVDGLATDIDVVAGEAGDHLQISALGGNDAVAVSADAAALIGVTVDLGSDQA